MKYQENEARKMIINAGRALLGKGLVARTWGNISARISDDQFIITPSGRSYEDMLPEDLVLVNIDDLSYQGRLKPSSEKGVHAEVYKQRASAGFVIHTHQPFASAISISGDDFPFAPCAEYGLPGTKKLMQNVAKSIESNPGSKAFLLQRHGALCIGDSFGDAFAIAEDLEFKSKAEFIKGLGLTPGSDDELYNLTKRLYNKLNPYLDDFAQMFGWSLDLSYGRENLCTGEDKEAEDMVLIKNCCAALYAKYTGVGPLGFADACVQRIVYKNKYSKLKDK